MIILGSLWSVFILHISNNASQLENNQYLEVIDKICICKLSLWIPLIEKWFKIQDGVGLFKSRFEIYAENVVYTAGQSPLCISICIKNWFRSYGKEENHHKWNFKWLLMNNKIQSFLFRNVLDWLTQDPGQHMVLDIVVSYRTVV